MAFYGDRMPRFIEASTEARLQAKLTELSLALEQKLEIMTIYPRNGRIVAWYFLDMKKANQVTVPESEPKKKVTKKKTRKKASKVP